MDVQPRFLCMPHTWATLSPQKKIHTSAGLTAMATQKFSTMCNNSSEFLVIKKQDCLERNHPAFGLEDSNDY